jgi:hypothetical protein
MGASEWYSPWIPDGTSVELSDVVCEISERFFVYDGVYTDCSWHSLVIRECCYSGGCKAERLWFGIKSGEATDPVPGKRVLCRARAGVLKASVTTRLTSSVFINANAITASVTSGSVANANIDIYKVNPSGGVQFDDDGATYRP